MLDAPSFVERYVRGQKMIDAIARLRKTADAYNLRARHPDISPANIADMIDLAARWHWLAGEAAILCEDSKGFSDMDAAACASCRERCSA